MRARVRFVVVMALALAVSPAAAPAQQMVPAIADPAAAWLVSGVVRKHDGRPLAGVVVERVTDATGRTVYASGMDRITTDAHGRFEYRFDGLGYRTQRKWYLAVRRPGCRGVVATVQLHEGTVPPRGSVGDIATGIELRLPACVRDVP